MIVYFFIWLVVHLDIEQACMKFFEFYDPSYAHTFSCSLYAWKSRNKIHWLLSLV